MKLKSLLSVLSVVLIAVVLRPAVATIGPVLNQLIDYWSLSQVEASLLVSMPVVCFGLGAFVSPWLVSRVGLKNAVSILLTTLAISIAFRVWFGFAVMLGLSLVAALSIAMLNVLLPTVIRAEFKNNIPRMTGVYTTTASLFASLSAFVTVPLVQAFGDFKWSLTFWVIPSVLAIATWQLLVWVQRSELLTETPEEVHKSSKVFRSPITWAITGLFGIQSANFYAVMNWLPSLLESEGYSQAQAGSWTAATTLVGIPMGLLVSQNLKRFKRLGAFSIGISLWTGVGMLMMLSTGWLQLVGALWAGIGLGVTFPLSLALIGVKGTTKAQTTLLSSIAQGVGYLIAAAGAFFMGVLYDLTGGWSISLITLAAGCVLQSICAGIAASKRPL